MLEKEEYEVYGLRVDDREYNIGDICSPSRQWWQDELPGLPYNEELGLWEGEELNGTCAIEINCDFGVDPESIDKAVELISHYPGKHIYLIAGNVAEGGNDCGETIIKDATVLAKL